MTMKSLSKKRVCFSALTAVFILVLVLVAFVTAPAPVPQAVQISVLGQTNDPSGSTLTLVRVTNHTEQAQFFYLSTMVPCPSGWTSANEPVQKTGRLAAYAECQILLRAPVGAARWKFSCMSIPDVSKPEWLWYRLVRLAGLSRLNLRDQPPASYVWTTEMGL